MATTANTWIKENNYRWYEKFAINIIKCGPIPRHVAFIMDGNRRYAKNSGMEKIQGHSKGFEKLSECLQWCLDVGVEEVTTFAFSIENFKRSADEVEGLMDLARLKFRKFFEEEEKIHEKGVRIRILGNISLLPDDLQEIIAKAMLATEKNDKLFLNIAFSYTSHEEMTNSLRTLIDGSDQLQPEEDITDELLTLCLYTRNISNPDLLIRTSGESRMSDFLLWQISTTILYFTKALWPALTIWHFLYGIFCYQRSLLKISIFKERCTKHEEKSRENFPERVENFLNNVDKKRRDYLVNLVTKKINFTKFKDK